MSRRPRPDANNGRNLFALYIARFVGVLVTGAVMAVGLTWFDSSGGQLFAILVGGGAGLLAYLSFVRLFWQD